MAEITDAIKTRLNKWRDGLNIPFIEPEKLIVAFTHPSFKGMVPDAEDYERLEFLGDAVLGLITAEELVRGPQQSEGAMTEQRKQLVNRDKLAQVFDRLKMQPMIRTAQNYTPSIKDKADFVEGLFGALYLEQNYAACQELWDNIQKRMGINKKSTLPIPTTAEDKQNKESMQTFYKGLGLAPKNAKSLLQELCQKQNLELPSYDLIERSGPDHEPLFRVKVTAVTLNGPVPWKQSAIGEGKSRRIAEIRAAEALCKLIYLEYIPQE